MAGVLDRMEEYEASVTGANSDVNPKVPDQNDTTVIDDTSSTETITSTMKAVYYEKPLEFEVRSIPIPKVSDTEVLVKVSCCGVCGTDKHIHAGGFLATFPLIPGHEVVGTISKIGKDVKGLAVGDRCVADPSVYCGACFQCHRGKTHLCKTRGAHGGDFPGGFSEYVVYRAIDVYRIHTLTDEQACLVEPMSCAIHAIDMLRYTADTDVLILGAGPAGLLFSQLLKINGANKVVLASNKGRKVDIARQIHAADEYIEFDRDSPALQWTGLKERYPDGFDTVIDTTGSSEVLNRAVYHVRRGGTLLMYAIYHSDCKIQWSPGYMFVEEIQIVTAVGQSHCFPRAIEYLESGKIQTKGIVTDVYTIHEYQEALDKLAGRDTCKIIIKPS